MLKKEIIAELEKIARGEVSPGYTCDISEEYSADEHNCGCLCKEDRKPE